MSYQSFVIGSNTDVVAAEGHIVTYGGFDSHIHFICPQQAYESIASGITTMLGGGTGPRYVSPRHFSIEELIIEAREAMQLHARRARI